MPLGHGLPWSRCFALLFLYCSFLTVTSAQRTFVSPLEEWLRSLVIHIPNQMFAKAGFRVNVSDFTCTDLQLGGLSTTHQPSSTTVVYNVNGAHAVCQTRWSYYHSTLLLHGRGLVQAVLGNATASGNLSIGMAGTPSLPYMAQLNSCDMIVGVETLKFTGGVQSSILNLLSPAIISIIQKVVPTETCKQLQEVVGVKLTGALHTINQHVQTLSPNITAPEDPLVPGMLQWANSPFLRDADALMNKLMGPDSPIGVDRLVAHLTHGTGRLALPKLNVTTPWLGPILSGSYLRLGLSGLDVSGLDSFGPLNNSIAQVWGNHSLRTSISLGRLRVKVQGTIEVHPDSPVIHGADLTEHFALRMDLNDVALDVILQVMLNETSVDALDDLQIIHPGCLVHAIASHGIQVLNTSLSMQLSNVALVAKEGALEADLDRAITATLALALDIYTSMLPTVLNGILIQDGIPLLNLWIANALASAAGAVCPSPLPLLPVPEVPSTISTDLSRWLNQLQVDVPATSFAALGFQVNVSGVQCSILQIAGVSSHHSIAEDDTLELSLAGVALRCHGQYAYGSQRFWASMSQDDHNGTFLMVANDTYLHLGLRLHMTGPYPVASSSTISSCGLQLSLPELSFTGGVVAWVGNALAPVLQEIIQRDAGPLLCKAVIPTALAHAVDSLLHSLTTSLIPATLKPGPQPQPEFPRPGMVEWNKIPFLREINEAIGQLVNTIDEMAAEVTNGTGAVAFNNFHIAIPPLMVPHLGQLALTITGLAFTGIDTWRQLDVLQAVDRQSLEFRLAADQFSVTLAVTANVHFLSTVLQAPDLQETISISVGMRLNGLETRIFLPISETALQSITGSQFFSKGCLLPAIDAVELSYLAFNFDTPKLTLLTGHTLDGEVEQVVTNTVQTVIDGYVQMLPSLVNGSLNSAMHAFNSAAPQLLQLAKLTSGPCPTDEFKEHADEADRNRSIGEAAIYSFLAVIIVALVLAIGYEWRLRRGAYVGNRPTSLIYSDALPWYLRYGLALLICGNLILFVTSNTHTGAVVGLQVTVLGDVYRLPQGLFDFALGNTVDEMWHARVYPLAILIAVFSGIWPYVKLLVMLFVWTLPESIFGASRREWCLVWLDRLGKWSLIDAYVLVLMMVAFRFHIARMVPDQGALALDVLVEPQWGFFSFLLATQLSLVLSHAILAAYRFTARCPHSDIFSHSSQSSLGDIQEKVDTIETLSDHQFRFGSLLLSLAPARWAVASSLFLAACLLCMGAFLKTFQFHFEGLAGWVLAERATTSYSLVSLALTLPESTEDPGALSLLWIQVTYLLFAFAVPLLQLGVLALLWLTPLRIINQKRWFVFAEVMNAWSALDVFIVSIVAALLQIQQFAQFIVGGRCDFINSILAQHFADKLHGDPVCFDVIATVGPASAVLFTAGAMLFIITQGVMALCLCAMKQRCAESQEADAFKPLSPGSLTVVRWLAWLHLAHVEDGDEVTPLRPEGSSDGETLLA